MTPEQQARVRAATHVRTAIRRAAWEFATGEPVATDGSVAGASVSFGPPFDVLDVPLCGMRAAVVAHRVAFAQMRECAEAARGASRSWDDVAAALDLPVRDGEPRAPGQVAFEWLIEGRDPESGPDRAASLSPVSPSAFWTCLSCGARVSDRGPYEAHPDDNEVGHDPTCARRLAEVQAHDREWGEF